MVQEAPLKIYARGVVSYFYFSRAPRARAENKANQQYHFKVDTHRSLGAGRFSRALDAPTRRKRRVVGLAEAKAFRKLQGARGVVPDRVLAVSALVQPGGIKALPWEDRGSARSKVLPTSPI
jgi:hypothetical protein